MVKLSGVLRCDTMQQCLIVRQYLPQHTQLTQQEPGCLYFSVRETDEPLVWQVEEQFRDQAAFDQHQLRVAASIWGEKTRGITREYSITLSDE